MLLIVGIFEIAWNGDDVSPKSWSGMSQYHVYPRFFTGSSLLRSWCTDNIDVKLHGGNDFTEFPLSPMITTRFGHCVHLLEKGQYSWPVSSCKTSERSQKNLLQALPLEKNKLLYLGWNHIVRVVLSLQMSVSHAASATPPISGQAKLPVPALQLLHQSMFLTASDLESIFRFQFKKKWCIYRPSLLTWMGPEFVLAFGVLYLNLLLTAWQLPNRLNWIKSTMIHKQQISADNKQPESEELLGRRVVQLLCRKLTAIPERENQLAVKLIFIHILLVLFSFINLSSKHSPWRYLKKIIRFDPMCKLLVRYDSKLLALGQIQTSNI